MSHKNNEHHFSSQKNPKSERHYHLRDQFPDKALSKSINSNIPFSFANVQPKLKVSQPGDIYEQEADRVAEQVMNMSNPSQTSRPISINADGKNIASRSQCSSCEMKKKRLKEEDESELKISRKASFGEKNDYTSNELSDGLNSIQGGGVPLDLSTREFMESRFGYDFGNVRIHNDERTSVYAHELNALAFTLRDNIIFRKGEYQPSTLSGKKLLAHELSHVIQQTQVSTKVFSRDRPTSATTQDNKLPSLSESYNPFSELKPLYKTGKRIIQRACPAEDCTKAIPGCSSPTEGSQEGFVAEEEKRQDPAIKRRARMTPTRARAHGHGGKARQLEIFLTNQTTGLLTPGPLSPDPLIHTHGVFIDQDISPNYGAYTWDCMSFTPPITGATKPCVFVPGALNQQALEFNTNPKALTIGGRTRHDWKVDTTQVLVHEIQHALFQKSTIMVPAGRSASCERSLLETELGELSAIMSEFPIAARTIHPVGHPANASDEARMKNWFDFTITNCMESIRGTLHKMRCQPVCSCGDIDKYIEGTFNFTSSDWSPSEKTRFNTELKDPKWGLRWPL